MDNRELSEDIVDKKEYERQKSELEKLIVYGSSPNYFVVKNNECSFGKTTIALNSLLQYREHNPRKRVLYVAERIDQCNENAEYVNKLFNCEVACSIVGNMEREKREECLNNYDIVFITHERYKKLCRKYNKCEQALYTDNRHLLIIDEKIEMCKEIKFCLSINAQNEAEIARLAGEEVLEKYKKIVEILKNDLMYCTKKDVFRKGIVTSFRSNSTKILALIRELRQLLSEKVEDKSVLYIDFEDKGYQTILEKLEDLEEIYTNQDIEYYSEQQKEVIIATPNKSLKMFLLENNIILDATAGIDMSYRYDNKLYHITNEKRIFKHNKWLVKWANINSTIYGKTEKYTNYTNAVNTIITQELGEYNTLVLATKYDDERPMAKGHKDVEKINKFKGIITHRGRVNSNNDFKNLVNAINTDLGYENEVSYVLRFLYYSNEKLGNWKSGKNGFLDSRLQKLKTYDVARGLYQFFKRVNRNFNSYTTIVFLCHKEEIKDIVIRNFMDINIKESVEIERLFEEKVKEKKTKIEQFIDMCTQFLHKKIPTNILNLLQNSKFSKYGDNVAKGIIAKSLLYECLKMSKDSFGKNILHNEQVTDFLNENDILVKYRNIVFKNF